MDKRVKVVLCSVAGFLAALVLYIILHEGGHALVAVLCGAEITSFSIVSAFVGYEGGMFTDFSYAMVHVMGSLLPYILSVTYGIFYPPDNKKGLLFKAFSFGFCVISYSTCLSWVFMPFIYLSGSAPQGEDVTKFLDASGLPPVIVSLSALLLIVISVCILFVRKIPQTYAAELKEICTSAKPQ